MARGRARDEQWAEAAKRYRLSAHHVAMGKALGMNPMTLGKLVPSPSQQWKAPLPDFIESCCERAFGQRGGTGRPGDPAAPDDG